MLGFLVLSSDQVKTTSRSEIYNAEKFWQFFFFFNHFGHFRRTMLFEYILFSVHQLQIDCESELLLF